MYSKLRKTVLASSIALALASASGAALAGTDCQNDKSHQANMPGQDISEARQETQILTSYSLNSYLRANDLQVSVDEGKATLTGTVEEDVSKQLAHDIAHGVAGIDSVDNQIKVDSDYAAPARTSQDRSFGEVVDDASITATVKSKMLWSKNTEGLQMNVDTSKGKVTLSGDAESEDAKALAATMAENTRGVVSVDNRLVVNSTKPASEVANNDSGKAGFPDVSDGWITTKVTSTFMYSANVESHNIEVSTDQGIVTLTGKVDSDIERKEAIELAGNIRGVKSVNATGLTI
jgi:osmotically-inducible protein OsmY